MKNAPYCLDANVFITAWCQYYPIRIFPSLWQKLSNARASLILIEPIFNEIEPFSGNDKNDLNQQQKKEKYPLRMWLLEEGFEASKLNDPVKYEQFYKGEKFPLFAWLRDVAEHKDGQLCKKEAQGTYWNFASETKNLTKEGSVSFPNGKKPERLLQRILHLSTNPGDLVLDSFAGSGTTGAVAHKMRRRWIMVELGEHCHSHIIPRMQKVIDGSGQGGFPKRSTGKAVDFATTVWHRRCWKKTSGSSGSSAKNTTLAC